MSENKETLTQTIKINDLLVAAVFSPTTSIPDGIAKIDLGGIGREA